MIKETYRLSLFLVGWSTFLLAAEHSEDVSSILAGYAKNRDQIKSYIIKLEMDTTFNARTTNSNFAPYNGTWKSYNSQDVRTDGDRFYIKTWHWGDNMRERRKISKEDANYNSMLYNGDKMYANTYSTKYPQKPDRVLIYPGGHEEYQKDSLCCGLQCHAAFGYFEGDLNTRIDELLKKSEVKLEAQIEDVNGFSCRVITANTTNGKYKLWIAPENGYTIVKATKSERVGDIHNGSPLPKGCSGFSVFEVTKMEEVDGTWIPTEMQFKGKTSYANGDYSRAEIVCKIDTLHLNPDHESLKSFELDDIRNGAKVTIRGKDNVQHDWHVWQDGKVVDKAGKVVMSCNDPNGITTIDSDRKGLQGSLLPFFENITIDLSSGQTKDKAILLCFCDLNQRPSRHTVQELVKKGEELKQKGIVVALVQAEAMEQKDLDEWVKKYQIPFAVGVLKDQPDKIQFDWGVKALPWLILTDRGQVVRAEGFGLDELDEKIQAIPHD